MHTLRTAALIPWAQTDPNLKAQATLALDLSLPVGEHEELVAPAAGPGRAARPLLELLVAALARGVVAVEL